MVEADIKDRMERAVQDLLKQMEKGREYVGGGGGLNDTRRGKTRMGSKDYVTFRYRSVCACRAGRELWSVWGPLRGLEG